ncbi:MAG: NAD(P)H-quinone oxidoreductase [Alphaproteobacteria bacterium]
MPTLPATMHHIRIRAPGDAENLFVEQTAVPQPDGDTVLIEVAAAGVNRPDILQRKGGYPPPPGASDIPGLEVSGTVVARGPACRRFAVGDEVCALVASGGYAAYCLAPEPQCLPVPAGVSLVAAGGLPETTFTVWFNLFMRGDLRAGESVLIHGGSSGIGTTAIQLAAAVGARIFTTVGTAAKAAACTALGADTVINYREQDFVGIIAAATAGEGVNVVLDMVGGDYVQKNIDSLAVEGRLIQIAFLNGATVTATMSSLMTKRLTWTGSTLRARSVAFKGEIAVSLEENVWPLIAAGRFRPLIHATFPLSEAAAAHRLMEDGRNIGKILLIP